jgi:methionyl-tRNA formyltransferase
MRIVFMGSAPLSCPSLEAIAAGGSDEVVAVITQPDRPKGRNLKTQPSVVRTAAERMGIPVLTPENVNAGDVIDRIRLLKPDLVVVVAYGQFLGQALLDMPSLGCLNMHPSLLPKYRGAAPIQWAIANG